MLYYKRSNSGRVSGGPDLKSTAAYTRQFCECVRQCWENAMRKDERPIIKHELLSDLLTAAGFLSVPEATSPPTAARPALRRMTMLGNPSCSLSNFH